jgi:hypothetical protein
MNCHLKNDLKKKKAVLVRTLVEPRPEQTGNDTHTGARAHTHTHNSNNEWSDPNLEPITLVYNATVNSPSTKCALTQTYAIEQYRTYASVHIIVTGT